MRRAAGLVGPVKGARQDHRLRAEPQVLGQHVAPRQQAFSEPRDAAKTEAKAVALGGPGDALDDAQRERLEHEMQSEGKMQVVQSHEHLVQTRRADPVVQRRERARRFQQRGSVQPPGNPGFQPRKSDVGGGGTEG